MPKLFSNDSMTPQLCISSALNFLTAIPATTFRYVGVEYGRECYAGTAAPTPEPGTLTGPRACSMTCKGDPSQSCGAGNMYNLYATTTATDTVWATAPAVTTLS
jgi:iron transport multicopper oxidase